ncbi:MAG TPA: hypothetical protein PLY32_05565 [Salinivirgaceae bacterium]|nr:hypothetical protein [Salinivirgaceae bacterium]HQA76569.1 hypothetical protein [Salinivirgaceae bacterium]
MLTKPKDKDFFKMLRVTTYHRYFKGTGFYKFLFKAIAKLFLIVLIIVVLLLIAQRVIATDVKELFFAFTDKVPNHAIWIIFAISESFLGLIPPDLFIIWGQQYQYPMLIVTVLGLISYAGGLLSYGIGVLLMRNHKISAYIHQKHEKKALFLKRWGGFFIVIAALFPIPYSVATLVAGMVGYRFDRLALFGLARIARFYLYAVVIFGLI